MKSIIDDIEARRCARDLLLAAVFTAVVTNAAFERLLFAALNYCFPNRPRKDHHYIDPEAEHFFLLSAFILLVCASCTWLFRRRRLITEEGVCHYPLLACRTNDFLWRDVLSWGTKVTLSHDDTGNEYPSAQFDVQLRTGRIINEPAFSEIDLTAALEEKVGKRFNILPRLTGAQHSPEEYADAPVDWK